MSNVTPRHAALVALHRYFVWSEQMRRHYDERRKYYVDERKAHWEPYMAYWYGGLYVVVEGWQDLELSDPSVDRLLANTDRVELLKRYRNGAFHYQKSYFDPRFVDLWARDDAAIWVGELHQAFDRWFQDRPETRS